MSQDRRTLHYGRVGAGLLASLAVVRSVAHATGAGVFVAGHELRWRCIIRETLGVVCPGCGMTRSVVFSLHGDLARAVEMNPAGPLLVAGCLVLGALLLASALRRGRGDARPHAHAFMRRVVVGTAAYGGLVFVVLLANWLRQIT